VYWQHDLSSYAGLAVSGDKVYVTDADSHVFAFNRATGKVIWEQADLFGRHLTGPTVVGDYVVVADAKGYVHWLSAQDGHFAARTFVDSKGVIANPVVDGSSIYVYGNSGRLVKYGIS
jgi:outer membrane protein assembly factor BamB